MATGSTAWCAIAPTRLRGILNGVDYSIWSPENDTLIAARYSAKDLSGKQACKKDLLAQFNLPDAESEAAGDRHRFALRGPKRF